MSSGHLQCADYKIAPNTFTSVLNAKAVYVCQHQGVTFLLGDCSESEADIAIKVHGFHGKYVQNCCFVSLE